MIDAAKIEELWGLDAKATPGPWSTHLVDDTTIVSPTREVATTCDSAQTEREDGYNIEYEQMEADAALIVAMRNALPALLDLAASLASAGEDGGSLANLVVREVAELPNRTSPDDMPDMLLVTAQELHDIVDAAHTTRIRALASEKEGLRRELVARTHERDVHARSAFDLSQQSVDWQPQLSALRAENERLRKALGWAMRRIDKYARHRAEEGDGELYEFASARSELEAGHE